MGIYGIVERYIKEKRKGVIATVVCRTGSAPREAGAKMFIGEEGRSYGTIGGGSLELKTIEEALGIMDKDIIKVLQIRMDSESVAEEGMICGGNVDIFLEPVSDRWLEVYKGIRELEETDKRAVLVTGFGDKLISKTVIYQDLKSIGHPLSGDEIARFHRYIYEKAPFIIDGLLIEPIQVFHRLYIFGAGHVSQVLSKIAKMVDFYVVVTDDREAFANAERFPEADEIIVDDFNSVFNRLSFTGKEFVVIVTRGHQHDLDVLNETLKMPVKYTGMIGSKRKVKMIMEHLRESGISEERIKAIHAPIGLDIGAKTPAEIAVSIVAELIKERAIA